MITVVIISFNRSELVRRQLRYYANCGQPYRILVADCSEPPHRELISESVAAASANGLDVELKSFDSSLAATQCIFRSISENVDTDLVCFVADDDFIVLPALDDCIALMQRDKTISAVGGAATVFQTSTDGAHGKILRDNAYRLPECLDEDPGVRLYNYLSHYAPADFLVRRTSELIANSRHLNENGLFHSASDRYSGWFGEMTDGAMTVARGKIARLSRPYMVRQDHGDMKSKVTSARLDTLDWISDPRWSEQFNAFVDGVCLALSQSGSMLSEQQRTEVARFAFSAYLRRNLSNSFDPYHVGIGKHVPQDGLVTRLRKKLNVARLRIHQDIRAVYHVIEQQAV